MVADLFFGMEVAKVQEILRAQEMTRVPLAPSAVRGLINLRGQIVATVDMRRLLKLPPREARAPSLNVIIRTAQGLLSLIVDDVGDVLDVPDSDFEAPPETMREARELVVGVYKVDEKLLLLVDPEKIMQLMRSNDIRSRSSTNQEAFSG